MMFSHDNCNMYIQVKVLEKELVNGMNVYRVKVVRLKDRNADKVF